MVDALTFREAMGRFPTGVTVVTAVRSDGVPLGMTVNAFTSLSLHPPLVVVCISKTSSSHEALLAAPAFTVNILADDQTDVAVRFAQGTVEERFEGMDWSAGANGAPRLDGVAAWIECTLDGVHPGGDHSILVGRVEAVGTTDREALVFHRGAYGVFLP